MNAGLAFGLSVGVSLGLSTILVYVLRLPLRQVLNAICSSGEATQFWVSFTSVMLYITPLIFAVFVLSPESGPDAVRVLRQTLLATLFGASIALLIVGLRISSVSPQIRESSVSH